MESRAERRITRTEPWAPIQSPAQRLSLEHQSRWVDRVQMGPWRLSSAVLTFPKGNEKPPKPQRRKVMGLDLHFRERKSLWPQYQEQIQDYVR